ncbi:Heterogeneous nuclear ribonucleoprotein 1 [Camellia lanceoleosa]|uniref:Heterogeneous nuclear ribonucleoprotein 1 n=1 Tax=Camellia lanceoleosa TaxID=1840588 RepID=A0ACC0IVX1_9ERIC|nr:Heterogeneous nuclear ribonucleoprotein 1 [Camellia lanceoleosa]
MSAQGLCAVIEYNGLALGCKMRFSMGSEHRKLFVGGISQETKEESLKEHFIKYGEVIESEIIRDRTTGNGRGFGFVTLADLSVVAAVLQDEHIILGRKVEVKVAKPKDEQLSNKKIFVGGLPPSLTGEELKEYFEKFGVITDGVVICDKESNRSRGFGFVTFDSENVVNNILQNTFYELNGKSVEVKKATPKHNSSRHTYVLWKFYLYPNGLDNNVYIPHLPIFAENLVGRNTYYGVENYCFPNGGITTEGNFDENITGRGNVQTNDDGENLLIPAANGNSGEDDLENIEIIAEGNFDENVAGGNVQTNDDAENLLIPAANGNSVGVILSRTNDGGENDIPKSVVPNCTILSQTNGGAFLSEEDEAEHDLEHRKGADCQLTPCNSS